MKPDQKLNNKSGIYKITNLINGKCYIGKTKNFYNRVYHYLYDVKRKDTKKINPYFLNSILKYGIENFEFSVIEFVDLDNLAERELYWIKNFKSTNSKHGYNLRLDSSTGMIVHPKTSEKISKRLKEEWKSGNRNNHSNKLKKYWKNNAQRKKEQSKLLKQVKTKYQYIIKKSNFSKICDYQMLIELGLKNCMATFHKKQVDEINFKGYLIKRVNMPPVSQD